MSEQRDRITGLLQQWSEGRTSVVEELVPLVYPTLHRIAANHLRHERRDHTLQPTALVNEAYLRLVGAAESGWENRSHFYSVAAGLMRNILVDHARKRRAQKRGGAAAHITLDDGAMGADGDGIDILALDLALQELGGYDERAEQVVELKFFGGLTINEIADVIDVSPATVKRDWTAARAFLFRQLRPV